MKDAKTILAEVKQFFSELMAPDAPPVTPTPDAPKEYELKDGGKVMIDKLEVGGIVMIDGNAALPGDIELADGTKITVADNGAITTIELANPDAPAASEDMGAKFAAFETSTNEKFANYAAKFEAQEIQLGKMNTQLNKANKVIEQLLTLSQLIVDAPAANPDPSVKTTHNFSDTDPKPKNVDILFS